MRRSMRWPICPTSPRRPVRGCRSDAPKVLGRDGDAYRDRLRARAEQAGWVAWWSSTSATAASGADGYGRPGRCRPVAVRVHRTGRLRRSGRGRRRRPSGGRHRLPACPRLLSGGAGIIVPHGDSAAMSAALRAVLTDQVLAASLKENADRLAAELRWPTVGAAYAASGNNSWRAASSSPPDHPEAGFTPHRLRQGPTLPGGRMAMTSDAETTGQQGPSGEPRMPSVGGPLAGRSIVAPALDGPLSIQDGDGARRHTIPRWADAICGRPTGRLGRFRPLHGGR